MVYVFGVEGVPVFEMLFILMVLMLFGLIFILLEIRKLRKLISEEDVDIKRFEADLAKFEVDEDSKPPAALVNYVRDAEGKGISRDQIQKSLSAAGWRDKHIDSILGKL
jgi:hypothetical protein